MRNRKYVFIGPAGSGKSSIINQIIKDSKLIFYDILEVMTPYLKKYGSVTHENKDLLDKVVKEFIDSFRDKEFDIIELASGSYLPQVLEALKDQEVIVIYCSCPINLCRKRLKLRKRIVPDSYLKYQHQFNKEYYQKLKEKYNFELIIINTKNNIEKNIQKLQKFVFHKVEGI